MRASDEVTFLTLFRHSPLRTLAISVFPVVFAAVQLANALFTDLSILVGGFIAAALLGIAVLFTRHRLARMRLAALRAELEAGV